MSLKKTFVTAALAGITVLALSACHKEGPSAGHDKNACKKKECQGKSKCKTPAPAAKAKAGCHAKAH